MSKRLTRDAGPNISHTSGFSQLRREKKPARALHRRASKRTMQNLNPKIRNEPTNNLTGSDARGARLIHNLTKRARGSPIQALSRVPDRDHFLDEKAAGRRTFMQTNKYNVSNLN